MLTQWEISTVLAEMKGTHALMVRLMYGTEMGLMECMTLRVKDVDFGRREIILREGKGSKDRVTMFSIALTTSLPEQIEAARRVHDEDRVADCPGVMLPDALESKYRRSPFSGGGFGSSHPIDALVQQIPFDGSQEPPDFPLLPWPS